MAKHKPVVEMVSYGIHSQWDAEDKSLPKVKEFTTSIPAEVDIEFGFVVNIKKAKGKVLHYCIYHPDIPDEDGIPMPPFEGREHVRNNDWNFYLGDTLWEPVSNKIGNWRMTLTLDDTVIADKTFCVENDYPYEGAQFWTRRKMKHRPV